MKRYCALGLMLAFMFCVSSALVYATDTIPVHRNSDGFQTVYWNWTANSSGAASGITAGDVKGMLYKAWLAPDPVNPVATAYDIDIWEVVDFDSITVGNFTADLAASQISSNTGELKAITLWPTQNVAVGSRLKFNVTGSLNAGGTGGSGKLVVVFAPTSSE